MVTISLHVVIAKEFKVKGIHNERNSAKTFACTGYEEIHDIQWKNVSVYVQKLLQTINVRTEKAFGLLTGRQASNSAGLFVGTVRPM